MDKLNLRIIDATINELFICDNGVLYKFLTDEGPVYMATRYYDKVCIYMSNEFGVSDKLKLGKELKLVKDDKDLLALVSGSNNIIFIEDAVSMSCTNVYYGKNTTYIYDRYHLSAHEFKEIVKNEIRANKKVLERRGY